MSAQDTRAAILGASVELGSLDGLEQLSIGGLASTVEMSKSGLFAHFGSKRELQLATIELAWEIFHDEVLRDRADDPERSLGALIERWLSFYERRVFTGGCLFLVSAVEFAGHRGPVRDALADAVERQVAALEAAVSRARESGELHADRDPAQTAFELHSILVGADALFHVRDDPVVFELARATIAERLELPSPSVHGRL